MAGKFYSNGPQSECEPEDKIARQSSVRDVEVWFSRSSGTDCLRESQRDCVGIAQTNSFKTVNAVVDFRRIKRPGNATLNDANLHRMPFICQCGQCAGCRDNLQTF